MAWAFPIVPRDDELLGGYLCRCARAHGASAYGFCELQLGDRAFWARDFDRGSITRHDALLSAQSGISVERLRAATLGSWVSRLTPQHYRTTAGSAMTPWVNAAGVFHRVRRRHALQYCPECLRETETVRRQWRLSFVVMCPIHQRPLRDACPACDAPFVPHRALRRLDLCHVCRSSLLYPGQPTSTLMDRFPSLLQVQQALLSLLDEGGEANGVLKGADFTGLRTVLTIFLGKTSAVLSSQLLCVDAADRDVVGPRIELSRHSRRIAVMAACAAILDDWPASFHMIAKRLGMTQRRFEPYAGLSPWLAAEKTKLPLGVTRTGSSTRPKKCSELEMLETVRPTNWRAIRASILMRAARNVR